MPHFSRSMLRCTEDDQWLLMPQCYAAGAQRCVALPTAVVPAAAETDDLAEYESCAQSADFTRKRRVARQLQAPAPKKRALIMDGTEKRKEQAIRQNVQRYAAQVICCPIETENNLCRAVVRRQFIFDVLFRPTGYIF